MPNGWDPTSPKSETAKVLREMAERCWRAAEGAPDRERHRYLITAADYHAKALEIEAEWVGVVGLVS